MATPAALPYPFCAVLRRAPGRSGGAPVLLWARGKSRERGVFVGGWGWECATGVVAQKCRCRVGWEVARPSPSPDPDEEISTIRLLR